MIWLALAIVLLATAGALGYVHNANRIDELRDHASKNLITRDEWQRGNKITDEAKDRLLERVMAVENEQRDQRSRRMRIARGQIKLVTKKPGGEGGGAA